MISSDGLARQSRMQLRIEEMGQTSSDHLPSTQDLFAATNRLRNQMQQQRADAQALIAELEGGNEAEEALAQRLNSYSEALDEALDRAHPAPHYLATVSGLEQRLHPDQLDQVMGREAMQSCADASLENAMYSGHDILRGHPEPTRGGDFPFRYLEQKHAWDQECSAANMNGRNYGYTPMSPVKEEVRKVLTDEQLIQSDQRQINAAMLGHTPMAERMGINPLERQAAEIYGTPMLDHHQALDSGTPAPGHMMNGIEVQGGKGPELG